MKFFNLNKLNKKRNWTVSALVICFSLTVLFGSFLHDHDLDSSHLDLDCVACYLTQASVGLETDAPELSSNIQASTWTLTVARVSIVLPQLNTSSRAPPVVC